jgi:DNA-binding transcriptional LysR family regulator
MDITIVQLAMLKAVAEAGTIAAAAEQLNYTPSAVSQQLALMGKGVGSPVLERVGRNVRLSDVGRVLVDRAQVILRELEAAQAAVEQVRSQVGGVIRFGYFESMTTSVMVPLVRRVEHELPDVELHTWEQGQDGGHELHTGFVDIATVIEDEWEQPMAAGGVVVEWMHTEPLLLVAPESSTITKGVRLADLADELFILPAAHTPGGQLAWSACRRAGFEPRSRHNVDVLPTALRLVAAGAGVSLVPSLALGDPPAGLRIIDLPDVIARRIGMAHREASAERPALRAVVDVVRDLLAAAERTEL